VLSFLVWLGKGGADEGKAGDVKGDAARLQKLAAPFDPEPFIRKAPAGKVFMGLDGGRKPIYLPRHILDKNHLEILGESGTGKSSVAGVMLAQLAAGEAVVIFDPKNDRNLPGALARAGEVHGYPFHILDLRPQADFPQINPFSGCRADQVEELLQVALELGKTGEAAVDFYRGKDREATSFIASALADGKTDMLEIINKAGADERVVEQENLWRELRQLGRVRALHTTDGLNLEEALSKPGVLYVIGSTTRLEVVAAQKLILQRILQILDERSDQDMPVALFLDELKYLLSPASLRAAGTVRDRNCHLIFAHQSLGDLEDCPGLSPKAVRGAIWGNCGIKIAYRMMDAVTAAELSRIAGQSIVESESRSESDNGESLARRDERREYMPPHVFTHLPKPAQGEASVGVVFGLGAAFYLSTRYIQSGPCPEPERAPEAGQGGAVPAEENKVSENGESMNTSQFADEV
ncbi:MAG: TraM recognition domain-containing protein, partial [Pseudomonadota bacterium]